MELAPRPTVVEASVRDVEGSELDGDIVVGSDSGIGVGEAEERKRAVAESVSFEGVAVVTWEAAGPIILVGGENRGLKRKSFFDGGDEVLRRLS